MRTGWPSPLTTYSRVPVTARSYLTTLKAHQTYKQVAKFSDRHAEGAFLHAHYSPMPVLTPIAQNKGKVRRTYDALRQLRIEPLCLYRAARTGGVERTRTTMTSASWYSVRMARSMRK